MSERFLCVLLCAMIATCLYADEVHLVNGDRLTGKIESLTDAKMKLKSDLAGEITIDLANISTFKTDEAVTINLKDGTTLKQQAAIATEGEFAITGSDTVKPQNFSVAAIESINPPPKPVPAWHGSISAGITASRGNTVTDSISATANAAKRTEIDRTTVSGYYIRSKQQDPDTGEKVKTEDTWRVRGKYDYFFSKKLFGFVDGYYEKDAIALLDRRVIVGAGAGYQWIEQDDFNFSTSAGLASLYEKYDDATGSNSNVTAQAGYHIDKKFNKKFSFIHDLTYYPSLEKFSDYFLTASAELRADITDKMFANFTVLFDYDSTPAQDRGSTDTKYIFGVGVNF